VIGPLEAAGHTLRGAATGGIWVRQFAGSTGGGFLVRQHSEPRQRRGTRCPGSQGAGPCPRKGRGPGRLHPTCREGLHQTFAPTNLAAPDGRCDPPRLPWPSGSPRPGFGGNSGAGLLLAVIGGGALLTSLAIYGVGATPGGDPVLLGDCRRCPPAALGLNIVTTLTAGGPRGRPRPAVGFSRPTALRIAMADRPRARC